MIQIKNRGMALEWSDYWDSDHARAGYCYLSWNANAARLLVPDKQKALLQEMAGAREVLISRGQWPEQGGRDGIELLWEDGSDNPFCLHLVAEQCDRLVPAADQGSGITVIVYTRGGEEGRWPGRYRIVSKIPWLLPWREH